MSSYSFLLSLKPGPEERAKVRGVQPSPRGQGGGLGDWGWEGEPCASLLGGCGVLYPSPAVWPQASHFPSLSTFSLCTMGTINAPVLLRLQDDEKKWPLQHLASNDGEKAEDGCFHTTTAIITPGTRASCQGICLGPSA